jgi:hypothetical protein
MVTGAAEFHQTTFYVSYTIFILKRFEEIMTPQLSKERPV